MMVERLGPYNRNRALDADSNSRVDLFLRSESPRVQQILLHQQLKEDIEKNSTGKVRYIESELHLRRNHERSPAASEVQSTTLNIGVPPTINKLQTSRIITTPSSPTKRDTRPLSSEADSVESNSGGNQVQQAIGINRHCQTCQIKEVTQNLSLHNKMIQEQTEQIRQLKTKFLRSYFERQI